MFGVCANEFANDDGRVVSLNHGCGAHSEAQLRKKQLPPPLPDHVFDTVSVDDYERVLSRSAQSVRPDHVVRRHGEVAVAPQLDQLQVVPTREQRPSVGRNSSGARCDRRTHLVKAEAAN